MVKMILSQKTGLKILPLRPESAACVFHEGD